MTTDGHVTFRNAPLALATVEFRFPDEIGPSVSPRILRAFRDVLGGEWITEQIRQQALTINVGGSVPTNPAVTIPRFTVRDRTMAVMVSGGSLTVETTRYESWSAFRAAVERALEATRATIRPDGITRVGARYINEIRLLRNPESAAEWVDWLAPGLLPPGVQEMTTSHWPPVNWNGAAQYQLGPERHLVIRYGPQPASPGWAVNPDGLLRRPDSTPIGPFFLVDFDAFWQPATVPKWNSPELLMVCDELHGPIEMVFDELITKRLIDEVFNASRPADG